MNANTVRCSTTSQAETINQSFSNRTLPNNRGFETQARENFSWRQSIIIGANSSSSSQEEDTQNIRCH